MSPDEVVWTCDGCRNSVAQGTVDVPIRLFQQKNDEGAENGRSSTGMDSGRLAAVGLEAHVIGLECD